MVSKIYRPRKLKKIAGIEKIPSMKKCGAVIGSAYLQRCRGGGIERSEFNTMRYSPMSN